MALAYTSALLKLSGEALAGEKGFGFDPQVLEMLAGEIKQVHSMGASISLVIGGGNILRGATATSEGLDRVSADYMGMLATVINALALQGVLEHHGIPAILRSATVPGYGAVRRDWGTSAWGEILVPPQPAITWPKPPDIPRLQYVGEITGSQDLRASKSAGQVWNEILYGPTPPTPLTTTRSGRSATLTRRRTACSTAAAREVAPPAPPCRSWPRVPWPADSTS